MKILLINHYAGSKEYGMEYRPYYLSREWVRMGHEVKIVAASYSHLRIKQPDLKGQSVLEEEIEGISYRWLKTPSYKGNGLARIRNMLCFLRRLWFQSKELAEDYKPDVVICSSTYPLDIFLGRRISFMSQAKLVFEVHDLWPLSPQELGNMPAWHPFIAVMQLAENYAYKYSDKVVSILPKAKSYMREHGMAEGKFVHIPNGIDVLEWEAQHEKLPEIHSLSLEDLRQKGKTLIGYAGAIGIANALDAFVETGLLIRNLPIALVIVGDGPEKERLQEKVENLGLDNVVILPRIPKSAVPAFLKEMDALFFSLKDSPLFRFGISPNKMMDYLMAGKPILQAVNAGNNMVKEASCGLHIEQNNPQEIFKTIQKFVKMGPSLRDIWGKNGKNYVLKHHNYAELANNFIEAIR